MITLRAEIDRAIDGNINIHYTWWLQSKNHFMIRTIKSQKAFMQLNARYSKWMMKTVVAPELVKINKTGRTVVILETEFV